MTVHVTYRYECDQCHLVKEDFFEHLPGSPLRVPGAFGGRAFGWDLCDKCFDEASRIFHRYLSSAKKDDFVISLPPTVGKGGGSNPSWNT